MCKAVLSPLVSAPPGLGRLLARGRSLALSLALLGLIALQSGCMPATGTAPAAQGSSLWQEFERIERASRGRPAEQARRLQTLQQQTTAGSPERLEALSLRGVMLSRLRDRALLEQLLAELRNWPEARSKPAAEVVALVVQARFQQEQGQLREALKTLQGLDGQDLRALPERLRLRAEMARANVLGEVGEIDAALLAGQEGLRLADKLGQGWRRAVVFSDMAMSYYRAQQLERARQTSIVALGEARLDPDPETLNKALTIYGITHAEHPDVSIAQQAYADALRYAQEAGSDVMQAMGLGNFADYHLRRGEFAQALKLAEQALPLARRSQHVSAEVLALHNMGIAKIGLKRLAEGTRDVRQAIQIDEVQGAVADAAAGWNELGSYLENAGDWDGAVHAYHQYRRLIDAVLRDETRKAVLDAQESFDAESRAKEIELLGRDNSLKTEQIRARDLQLWLWAAVAGCVLLSAVLLVLAYRRMRRSNVALARVNDDLKQQSERDPLTGLANRRFFQQAVQRLADAGKLSAAVYLIDIDLFKRINDQHGHAAGDSVLIEVAQRLRAALREDDLVVRWGGEEFLIVVPERSAADAQALAQRLLDLIGSEPVQHGDKSIPISASIGFAGVPVAPHGLALSWERAIDLVDTVMYMAKAHGRNRAYGVQSIEARDEAGLLALMPRMEAAWREGQVGLVSLQGPAHRQVSS